MDRCHLPSSLNITPWHSPCSQPWSFLARRQTNQTFPYLQTFSLGYLLECLLSLITRLVLMRRVGLSSDSTSYRQPSDLPNPIWVRCPHHLLLVVCTGSCQSPTMQGVVLCSHLWATWDGVGSYLFTCPAICSHGWYMVRTQFRTELEKWVLSVLLVIWWGEVVLFFPF